MKPKNPSPDRPNQQLRQSLRYSQHEAVSSSVMTGLCDNFINVFAISLKASLPQIAWLTAVPQFIGAASQLLALWIGSLTTRRKFIALSALLQSMTVLGLSGLAWYAPESAIEILILLTVLYHCTGNLVQPHWRALMGSLVPARRRGRFFGIRTRNSMITSFLVFIGGGFCLDAIDAGHAASRGFAILFLIAAAGRLLSSWQLYRMHDPVRIDDAIPGRVCERTIRSIRHALSNATFRNFILFTAGLQGTVAIAAPFFSVYLLRDLHYSYGEFTMNQASSILAQFLTLTAWGKISDRFGNRLIMVVTSLLIPILPMLWLVSDSYVYLLGVQAVAGIAWGGFSLSSGNYLYDLKPHQSHLATYSALQSVISATAIFVGALAGGYLAEITPRLFALFDQELAQTRNLFGVFAISALARLTMTLWFIPHMRELRLRRTTSLKSLIFRVARFTPITGVVLDWVGIARPISGSGAAPPRARGPENSPIQED